MKEKESKEMRILVVDDDPIMIDVLSEFLPVEKGYTLYYHHSAECALNSLLEVVVPYDCIILDIMLPGMNGVKFCEILKKSKHYTSVPILMITGSKELGLMSEAFSAGATDFITKPLSSQELVARVNSAGLLNQSLARANHTLSELSFLTKFHFDEPFSLNARGISDVLVMENELLRRRSECFPMTLLKLDISGLRGIYRSLSPAGYRHCLEVIGASAARAAQGKKVELAYIGSGRFLGICLDRFRLNFVSLTNDFNEVLNTNWKGATLAGFSVPTGKFSSISDRRFWSDGSASDALQLALKDPKGFSTLIDNQKNDLFSRLELKLDGSSLE